MNWKQLLKPVLLHPECASFAIKQLISKKIRIIDYYERRKPSYF